MHVQRKRILQMLEEGTISMDEALTLLENLQAKDEIPAKVEVAQVVEETKPKPVEKEQATGQEQDQKQSHQETHSSDQKESTVDDFLDDLRRDFTVAGDRFMQFMQTAVEKVKEMDLEAPFGKSFVFTHSVTQAATEIDRLALAVPSGKVTIHAKDEEEIRAEFTVKTYRRESEEEAKAEALEKMKITTENGLFSIASEIKIGQVDIDLYVPQKQYKNLEARLTNGALRAQGIGVEHIQVKTTNGAIQFNDVTSGLVEAETLNGRVYLDGDFKDVDAQSLNGSVVVTTENEKVEKIKAKTMSGSVELYIPSTIALSGEISSTVGKLDLGLEDVERNMEQDQLFQRTIRFNKEVPEQTTRLRLTGSAKTGTVLVRYII